MIITRLVISNDLAEVQTLMDVAFATLRDVYRPKPDAVPALKNVELDTQTIVALAGGEIVGAACVYQDTNELRVSQVAVVPKFRQRGVARKLLQFANDAAIECGASQLWLNTIQETGNVAIFQRLGFTVHSTTKATWCISDRFEQLHDVSMRRKCVGGESS